MDPFDGWDAFVEVPIARLRQLRDVELAARAIDDTAPKSLASAWQGVGTTQIDIGLLVELRRALRGTISAGVDSTTTDGIE